MNYYIQGCAAKADKIKAAFEKLGVASNANRYNYKNDHVLYFSAGGMMHMVDANGSWANIIKTHPGYKELELPIEPKFKVGDRVIYGGKERTITFMDDHFYDFDGGCAGCRIELQDELLRPAPKSHYDVSNFYVGMPVLVRPDNDCKWDYSVFSRNVDNQYWHFAVCNGVSFTQCIPFNEDTKHLLGTSDPCDEKYINW